MFVAAVLINGNALQVFAPSQLLDESEPPQRSMRAVDLSTHSMLRVIAWNVASDTLQAIGNRCARRPAGGADFFRTGAALVGPITAIGAAEAGIGGVDETASSVCNTAEGAVVTGVKTGAVV